MVTPTPLRPEQEVVGAYISITLGGQAYNLPVLPISANREWTAHLASEIRTKLNDVGPLDGADEVAVELAKSAETMMDLLISYDHAGAKARDTMPVLPDREWIDTHATDTECYQAMKRVTAAAYPFAPDLIRIVPEFMPILLQSVSKGVAAATVAIVSASLPSTNTARPSTAGGRRKTSNGTSPTSS